MEGKHFSINGIKVTATHLGGGLYVGIPDNLGEALLALLEGKLFEPRDIRLLPDEPKPEVKLPEPKRTPPAPKTDYSGETITQYRNRKGYSRTELAALLNIRRRSLGRWEEKGKKMAEV